MKRILTLILIIFYIPSFSQEVNDSIQQYRDSIIKIDTIDSIYIPKDIYDCFKQIDEFWNDSTKIQVKQWSENEFVGNAHFGFGMWMRNNWGLWRGSRLSIYFNDMGIYHPDDMTGIILTSYYRHLINKDVDFEGQVKDYKKYWEASKKQNQGNSEKDKKNCLKAQKWLKKKNIPLNHIINLDGRQLMYTCDSTIVLKKTIGDTIIFWTSGGMMPMRINKAEEEIKSNGFGKDTYISEISEDGRINFVYLHTTKFRIENDSLFELEEYSNFSYDTIYNISENLSDKEFAEFINKKMEIYKNSLFYKFKLIFHCSMFSGGNDTFAISTDTSMHADVIHLIGCWKVKDKQYYKIQISNHLSETPTLYELFFDDSFRFVSWEGCLSEELKQLTDENKISKTICK